LAGGVLAILLAVCVCLIRLHQLAPWVFEGEVDDASNNPIRGVEVVVTTYDSNGHAQEHSFQTGDNGKYHFELPQPEPEIIPIAWHKSGYFGGNTNHRTDAQDQPFKILMRLEEPAAK
jgi:hypothetical protein